MNVHRTVGIATLAFCLALPALRAEDAKVTKDADPKHATLEAQVAFLESALSEALRSRDWKQLELCTKGIKAAGLKDQALEISILRAERDAAWGVGSNALVGGYTAFNRPLCEAWGLAARHLSGNTQALGMLRAIASAEIPAVTPIAPDEYRKDSAETRKKMAANQEVALKRSQQEYAVLTLALLKEPGMKDKALALLNSRASSAKKDREGAPAIVSNLGAWTNYGATEPLVLAALVQDPAQGWQGLKDFVGSTDDALDVNYQFGVLSALFRLTMPADENNPWTRMNAFQVDEEIIKSLPKETANGNGLGKAFASLSNRYQADPKQQYSQPLSGIFYTLPTGTKDADLIGGLEALKSKVSGPYAQWLKSQIDKTLAKVRGEEVAEGINPGQQAPVAPPKLNEEF